MSLTPNCPQNKFHPTPNSTISALATSLFLEKKTQKNPKNLNPNSTRNNKHTLLRILGSRPGAHPQRRPLEPWAPPGGSGVTTGSLGHLGVILGSAIPGFCVPAGLPALPELPWQVGGFSPSVLWLQNEVTALKETKEPLQGEEQPWES